MSDRDAGWYANPANGGRNTFWTGQQAAAALKFSKTTDRAPGKTGRAVTRPSATLTRCC
ncbi:hypothetical protein [Amycolatopsis rifamycinica]|uniref:hypothetical protein n=1 Tax=Amycolatopsis rifamycinica TaxID=287986 RepID=UPI000AC27660|nr:hypothetical protein [Amycolatopsis rifamycinica]